MRYLIKRYLEVQREIKMEEGKVIDTKRFGRRFRGRPNHKLRLLMQEAFSLKQQISKGPQTKSKVEGFEEK